MSRFRIAHSGITWGYDAETAEEAIRDVSELGYRAYETIGRIIEQYEEQKGEGFDDLLARHDIPLAAVYCGTTFVDAAEAAEHVENVMRWAKRGQELGATSLVLAAGSRRPEPYTKAGQWRGMARVFNDIARRAADLGLITALHPHTGTLIETRAEIDAILDAIDPNLVFFAPDTGQIAKAGDDPIAALQAYKRLLRHIHLKDYGGGKVTGYAGYTPVGGGVVDIPAIFDILEETEFDDWVTVELDSTADVPRPPREAAAMSKRYLEKLLGNRAEWQTL